MNNKIKTYFIGFLSALLAILIFVPTEAQAACDPKIRIMTASPKTISRAKPTVNLAVKVTGADTCTQQSAPNITVSVKIMTTGYEAVSWNLTEVIGLFPGQTEYTLEGSPNIFEAAPGIDAWKTIRLYPSILNSGKVYSKFSSYEDITNTSGTENKTYTNPPDTQTPPTQTPPTKTPSTTPVPNPEVPYNDVATGLDIKNPSNQTDVVAVINKFINWLLLIIAMVAGVMIIYSGLMLIFNGGDQARISKAKSILQWSIIGLTIAILSFALVSIVQGLLQR